MGYFTERICEHCGYVGFPGRVTPGSFLIELAAWCLFIVPGILYSMWRISARYDACKKCGAPNMIPIDTPRGKQLVKAFGQ
jgi:hypothetical protein